MVRKHPSTLACYRHHRFSLWMEKRKRVARKALHLSERPVIEDKVCVDSSIHIVSRLQVWWAKVKKFGAFHMCLRWWSFAFLICGLIFNFMSKTWTWSHWINGFDMTTSHKFGLELEKPIPQKQGNPWDIVPPSYAHVRKGSNSFILDHQELATQGRAQDMCLWQLHEIK